MFTVGTIGQGGIESCQPNHGSSQGKMLSYKKPNSTGGEADSCEYEPFDLRIFVH